MESLKEKWHMQIDAPSCGYVIMTNNSVGLQHIATEKI